jgi:hypothetical protein
LPAYGELTINGKTLSWSGSQTDYETDVKVFSNGNLEISHQGTPRGRRRFLVAESNSLSTVSDNERRVGVIATLGRNLSDKIIRLTDYDFVVAGDDAAVPHEFSVVLKSIGDMSIDTIQGAFSAGPDLSTNDFSLHPINFDKSLGDQPPFLPERLMARMALFTTDDETLHIALFDGRPGSEQFAGVTPSETQHILAQKFGEVHGVFLDPGQTAKMSVRIRHGARSVGNRHYVKYPQNDHDTFVWTPDTGRAVANVITL